MACTLGMIGKERLGPAPRQAPDCTWRCSAGLVRRLLVVLAAATGAVALTGCEQSLAVKAEGDVPAAMVERLPATVAVRYPEQFRNHLYHEDTEDRPNWSVATGSSQVATFDRVLSSMFETVPAGPEGSAPPEADAILEPQIEEAQFATPRETKLEFYEAWFRYRVRLYEPDGQLITDWRFSAYGKSPKGFMAGRERGLNEAITVALRDAGAKLAVGLPAQPALKSWLQNQRR